MRRHPVCQHTTYAEAARCLTEQVTDDRAEAAERQIGPRMRQIRRRSDHFAIVERRQA